MYTGKIIYQGNQITVESAVLLNLVVVDSNEDIWLAQDTNKSVKITGDLVLQ